MLSETFSTAKCLKGFLFPSPIMAGCALSVGHAGGYQLAAEFGQLKQPNLELYTHIISTKV